MIGNLGMTVNPTLSYQTKLARRRAHHKTRRASGFGANEKAGEQKSSLSPLDAALVATLEKQAKKLHKLAKMNKAGFLTKGIAKIQLAQAKAVDKRIKNIIRRGKAKRVFAKVQDKVWEATHGLGANEKAGEIVHSDRPATISPAFGLKHCVLAALLGVLAGRVIR